MKTHSCLSILLVSLISVFAGAGCSNGHCKPKTGTGGSGANAAPVVDITEPLQSAAFSIGASITIRYVDDDPDSAAITDLVIISSTGAQTRIVNDEPEANGAEHLFAWDTAGFDAGTYQIEARTTDGNKTAIDKSAAIITLETPPPPPPGGTLGFSGAQGATSESGYAVTTYPDGSFVVGGDFAKAGAATTLKFGAGEANETILTVDGLSEGFIVRYNSDGTLAWARQTKIVNATSSMAAQIAGVAALDDGTVACAGFVQFDAGGGQIVISANQPGAITLTYPATPGMNPHYGFVARFDGNGTALWASRILTDNAVQCNSMSAVATQGSSAVSGGAAFLVMGQTKGTTTFNAGEPSQLTVNIGINKTQIFICRFEADGTLAFVKTTDGQEFGNHEGYSVGAFPGGSFVVSGNRNGNIVLGPREAGEIAINSGTAGFIAHYNSSGAVEWARNFTVQAGAGDFGFYQIGNVAACADGTTILFGEFAVSSSGAPVLLTLGAGEPNQTILATTQTSNFIARFAADGTLIFAKLAGGRYIFITGIGTRAACFSDGSFLTTGYLSGGTSFAFGAGEANEIIVNTDGQSEFVARYAADGSFQWVRAGGAANGSLTGDSLPSAVATFPDGRSVVCGYHRGGIFDFGGPALLTLPNPGPPDLLTLRIAN